MYKIMVLNEWDGVQQEFEREDLEETRTLLIDLVQKGSVTINRIKVYEEVYLSFTLSVNFGD